MISDKGSIIIFFILIHLGGALVFLRGNSYNYKAQSLWKNALGYWFFFIFTVLYTFNAPEI